MFVPDTPFSPPCAGLDSGQVAHPAKPDQKKKKKTKRNQTILWMRTLRGLSFYVCEYVMCDFTSTHLLEFEFYLISIEPSQSDLCAY